MENKEKLPYASQEEKFIVRMFADGIIENNIYEGIDNVVGNDELYEELLLAYRKELCDCGEPIIGSDMVADVLCDIIRAKQLEVDGNRATCIAGVLGQKSIDDYKFAETSEQVQQS